MIRPFPRHRLSLAYVGLCAWIAGVSVHDAVLVVVHHNLISQTEQNPVGRWLIDVQGDIWLFVSLKLAGTAVVCTVLVRLYRYRHRLAFVVALAVACFQLWLLIHLHFS
jgi:hypothetical protein